MTESSPEVLRRPIFVLGCHKSGSTLVCCLLDGHKDLFVLPLEMHLLRYSGYWMNYPLQHDLPSMRSREARLAETFRNVRRANRSGQNYGMGRLDGRMDIDAFERRLRSHEWSDDSEFIQAAVSAAHVGLTGQPLPPGIRAVEKSVENAAGARNLHKLMPDCSFIHIVRNPYATVVAIRKSMSHHGYPELRRILLSIRNSFDAMVENARTIQPYKVLRYEDLVRDIPAVMHEVAAFLGVEFQDSMLTPTRLGELWQGNSTSDRKFDNVSLAPLENWRTSILPLEIALVNRFLEPMLERFGYERVSCPSRGLYRRVLHEGAWRYLKNRRLLIGRFAGILTR